VRSALRSALRECALRLAIAMMIDYRGAAGRCGQPFLREGGAEAMHTSAGAGVFDPEDCAAAGRRVWGTGSAVVEAPVARASGAAAQDMS
jgi:hypothetical protein